MATSASRSAGWRTAVAGEQRGAAQPEQGRADLGRIGRQHQVGDVAQQLGQRPRRRRRVSTGPNTGSGSTPTSSSASPPVTIRSTSTAGNRASRSAAAARTCRAPRRPSRTACCVGLVRGAEGLHHDRGADAARRRAPRRSRWCRPRRPAPGCRAGAAAPCPRPRRARARPPCRRATFSADARNAAADVPAGHRGRGRGGPGPADRRGGLHRLHRHRRRGEHRQPPPHPGRRPIPAQVARHRRDEGAPRTRPRCTPARTPSMARTPVVVGAAVGAGQVGEQQGEVGRAAHHGVERRGHRVRITPDVGVVVERVGERHPLPQHRAQLRALPGGQLREPHVPAGRSGVGDQRGLPARAAQRAQPGVRQRPAAVQQAQRAEQRVDRGHLADPGAAQEVRADRRVPGQRGGVRLHRPAGRLAAAQHQRDHPDAAIPGAGRPAVPARARRRASPGSARSRTPVRRPAARRRRGPPRSAPRCPTVTT